MGLTACRSVPFCLLLYPFRRVCQGGGRPKPPSAREVAARSAGGGRDVTRFFSPPVGCADSPLTEGALQRGSAVISEPVTVSLAWESVLSFVGKRIAAPVCGLARNDKVPRGGTHVSRRRTPHLSRRGTRAPPYKAAAQILGAKKESPCGLSFFAFRVKL